MCTRIRFRTEFQQPVAEPGHLGARTPGMRRVQPQLLHQHVGRGGEEDAPLVRPAPTAARPPDLQAFVQFFDPMLDVAAGTVDPLVQEPRRLSQIRHDESRIVLRLAAGELDDFRFDNDPARVAPRGGRIRHVGVDVFGLAARLALGARGRHGQFGGPLQDGVFGHGHDVVEPRRGIQEIKDLRGGEAAIEPHEHASLGKGESHEGLGEEIWEENSLW